MLYYKSPKFLSFFRDDDKKIIEDLKGKVKIVINSIPVAENNFNIFRIYVNYIIGKLLKFLLEKESIEKITLNYIIEDTIKYCRNYNDVLYNYEQKNYYYIFTISIFLSFLQHLKIIEENIENLGQEVTSYIIPKKLNIKFQTESTQIDKILRIYGHKKVGLTIDDYIIKLNKEEDLVNILKNIQETTVTVVDYNFIFRQIGIFDSLIMKDNFNCFIMGEGKIKLYQNYLEWLKKEKRIKKDIKFLQLKNYNFSKPRDYFVYFNPETDQKYCYFSGIDKNGNETIFFNDIFDFNAEANNPEIVEFFKDLGFKKVLKKEIRDNFIKISKLLSNAIEMNENIKTNLIKNNGISNDIKFSHSILYHDNFKDFAKIITNHKHHYPVLMRYLQFYYKLLKNNKENTKEVLQKSSVIYDELKKHILNDFKSEHIPNNFLKFIKNNYKNLISLNPEKCKKKVYG
ncbi:MAG: hypothetical protein ACFFAH_02100 [Promethearchaeota archaeon]